MRDLALLAVLIGSVPFIFRRPFYGLLLWVWFSVLNPHRLAYGFAYSFPFAMIVAIVVLTSLTVNAKKLYPFPINGTTVFMLLFILWINVSPVFSPYEEYDHFMWLRVLKVVVMVLITFYVVGNHEELHLLTWVLALSIGFYGVKGGLFTLINGGAERVWGPEGSFIEENNSLALAIIMAVPIFRYLQLHSSNLWTRRACLAIMLMCVASAVGSYSRGALVALAGMATFLWFKSPNKGVVGILGIVLGIIIFAFMPDAWSNRMNSINTYDEDTSAQGRINAWWMAWNLALSSFPIGGGFNIYISEVFARFAPNPNDIHAAHSIYFQVLGEHGFIGLFIFLGLFISAWRCGSWLIARTKNRPELRWAQDLAAMLQVSLVGYLVGGAFLSLAYYDFPYYVASMLVIARIIVKRQIEAVEKKPHTMKVNTDFRVANMLGVKKS